MVKIFVFDMEWIAQFTRGCVSSIWAVLVRIFQFFSNWHRIVLHCVKYAMNFGLVRFTNSGHKKCLVNWARKDW